MRNSNFPSWLLSHRHIVNKLDAEQTSTHSFTAGGLLLALFHLSLSPLFFLYLFLVILFYKLRCRKFTLSFQGAPLLFVGPHALDLEYFYSVNPPCLSRHIRVEPFSLPQYFSISIPTRFYLSIIHVVFLDLFAAASLQDPRSRFLTYVTSLCSAHLYVCYRAYFRYAYKQLCSSVSFVSMNLLMMSAASVEGLSVDVYLHGLAVKNHPLSIPPIRTLFVISPAEKAYFKAILPGASVLTYSTVPCFSRSNSAILLLRQITDPTCKDHTGMQIEDILYIAKILESANCRLYVKPHPRSDMESVANFMSDLPASNVTIVARSCGVRSLLRDIRPNVVFGWYSSGLAEALVHGIIPVRVRRPILPILRKNGIFDFVASTLDLRSDASLLLECLHNSTVYSSTISSLQSASFSA